MVEEKAGSMIEEAIDNYIAFLVVGDPFGYVESNYIIQRFNSVVLTFNL